jgi:hypothetical protein
MRSSVTALLKDAHLHKDDVIRVYNPSLQDYVHPFEIDGKTYSVPSLRGVSMPAVIAKIVGLELARKLAQEDGRKGLGTQEKVEEYLKQIIYE